MKSATWLYSFAPGPPSRVVADPVKLKTLLLVSMWLICWRLISVPKRSVWLPLVLVALARYSKMGSLYSRGDRTHPWS